MFMLLSNIPSSIFQSLFEDAIFGTFDDIIISSHKLAKPDPEILP